MSLPERAAEPVRVTVVESEGCHFCVEAHQVLETVADTYSLNVDRVDVRSQRGQALMARHRAPMSPLVLLDGEFFSSGRVPRRKLVHVLKGRLGHGAPPGPTAEDARNG